MQGAIYKVHSGIVSDRTPATANDRKLTVLVDGKSAKDIFDSIGPDLPETCTGEPGDRMREKKAFIAATPRRTRERKMAPIDAGSVSIFGLGTASEP